MKLHKLIILSFLIIQWNSFSQIDCNPTIGFSFKPNKKGIPLRDKPNSNGNILLQSPEPDGVWLSCTKKGFTNDFVEVKIEFIHDAFRENGVNTLLLDLYQYLKSDYEYGFNFQEFTEFIMIEENQKKIYKLLYNDQDNDWFKNYSSSKNYDVSTYEGFIKNWINFDKTNSNYKYIFENQERIVYVHKSLITNNNGAGILLQNAKSEYYFKEVKEQLSLKKENHCLYSEANLFWYFQFYIEALINEEPFKAIQEIQKYSNYFKNKKYLNKILFLKAKASYFDENLTSTVKVGQELIELFNSKQIRHNVNDNYGDINMAKVYKYTVSSLVNLKEFDKAIALSTICMNNKKLHHKRYLEFHAVILLNMNKKTEACDVLNTAYLKGDENARELIKKYCE